MLSWMQRIFTQMERLGGSMDELIACQQRNEQKIDRLEARLDGVQQGPATEVRSSRKTIAGHFIRKRPLSDDEELARFCDDLQDPDFFASMVSSFP